MSNYTRFRPTNNRRDIHNISDNSLKTGSYSEPFRNMDNYSEHDHYNNVNRLDIERGFTQHIQPRTGRYLPKNSYSHMYQEDDKIGEITGRYVEHNDIEQGMPMRSDELYETFNRKEIANPHLDFDIYNKQNPTDFNVEYYDPGLQTGDYAALNENSQIIKKHEETDLSKESNKFSIYFFKSLKKRINKDICYSPSNLLNSLVTFMGGSTGYTYNVMETVFGPHTPSEILGSLEKIKGEQELNVIYFPKRCKINPAYKSLLSQLCNIETYNEKDPYETDKINKIFYLYTKRTVNNIINREKLNGNALSINCNVFRTHWENFPCVIQKLKFKGVYRNFMVGKNMNQRFFGSKNSKLVELDLQDGSVIGFYKGDISKLQLSIDNLTITTFEHLSFPIFKKHTKYNLNQVIEAIGIDIFEDTEFKNITQQNVRIGNIVQENRVEVVPSSTDTIKAIGKGISISFNTNFLCYIKKNNIFTHILEMS